MKPKLVVLNLVLLAAIFAIVWQMRANLRAGEAMRQANVNVPVKPVPAPVTTPSIRPAAVPAAKYVEVADKNLFSKDRNATVAVEVPKVEPPKPMPPLPVVYGVMGLPSGTKAIMAERSGASTKPVRAGDTIGDFKVLALSNRDVTFEWDGKQIQKKIEDLVDRSSAQAAPEAAAAGPAAPPPPPPLSSPGSAPVSKDMGVELTPTMRACRPGDTAPPGSIVDGYKKEVTKSIFGETCRWNKQ